MTAIRSATLRTMLKSWVMSIIAMLRRSCRSLRSLRICAWIVTSSAVVGSSAINRSGSLASAIAIMTRCRWPPEISCGNAFKRSSARCSPTNSRSSSVRARTASRLIRWCTTSTSPTCRSIVCSGLSDVIGSWKIMLTRLPRIAKSCASLAPTISTPSSTTDPDGWLAWGGRSCGIESAVTDLPEPDSPTRASASPRSMWKSTPCTATSP